MTDTPDLLPIVKYPAPFLRKRTQPVEAIDDEVRSMVERMIVTMVEARGIGRLFGPGTPTTDAIAYVNEWFQTQSA